MNNTNKDNKTEVKSKIIDIANKIIQGKMDVIEGCRKIATLQYQLVLNTTNKNFLFFKGISSETEKFPFGQERATWSKESLVKLDKEKEDYIIEFKS